MAIRLPAEARLQCFMKDGRLDRVDWDGPTWAPVKVALPHQVEVEYCPRPWWSYLPWKAEQWKAEVVVALLSGVEGTDPLVSQYRLRKTGGADFYIDEYARTDSWRWLSWTYWRLNASAHKQYVRLGRRLLGWFWQISWIDEERFKTVRNTNSLSHIIRHSVRPRLPKLRSLPYGWPN